MAYDDSMPANIVTAQRSVVIVAPCKAGQQMCGKDCSSVPCQALSLFYNPVMDPTFTVPDSSVATIYLPCTGANFASRQAAVCSEVATVGSGTCVGLKGVDEYSSELVQTEVTATSCPIFNVPEEAEPALACPPCALTQLQAGSCAPGSYNLVYSYKYPDLDAPEPYSRGVEIRAEQSVTFEQLIGISMKINLLSDITEYSDVRLDHALRYVVNELWTGVKQIIEEEYLKNIQGYPGQEATQTRLTYITLSPTKQDGWTRVGNSPSTLLGAAWVHGMVSNNDSSLPWLDPSTVSVSVASALLSALRSAMDDAKPLRITWLELGLNDGGLLDEFETNTITTFTVVGDFQSISAGSVCPLWTDEQVLELSADVVSEKVTDVLDRLRVSSQGTSKAVPILAEIDTLIRMQYLGAAWCDVVKDSTTLSQILTLDISVDLENLQADKFTSVQLALLTGAKQSDCLERLNELTLLQVGTIPSAKDDGATESRTATKHVAVHDLKSQIAWQLVRQRGLQRLATVKTNAQVQKELGSKYSGRSLLDSTVVYQPALDADNAAAVQPTRLDCIKELDQHGCASVPRVIGHDRSGTKILGGVLIHQTRSLDFYCSKGFQNDLSFMCTTLTRSRGIATQVRSCMSEAVTSLPGFGSEPANNGRSALFSPLLSVEDFYNVSNEPLEVDCRGEPRPFQPVDLPGYDPGYPIVLEACTDAALTMRALQYVRDSR